MAISFVNASSNGNFTTSVNVSRPSGTQQGDVLVATVSSNNQTLNLPSGWVLAERENQGVMNYHLCYKVLGASEPGSYTFSFSSSTILTVGITGWRGVDNDTPLHNTNFNTSGNSTEPKSAPNLSITQPCRMLYARLSRRGNSTPMTFSASGVTKHYDLGNATGGVSYAQAGFGENSDRTSPQTVTGLSITGSPSQATDTVIYSVALQVGGEQHEGQATPLAVGEVDFDPAEYVRGRQGQTELSLSVAFVDAEGEVPDDFEYLPDLVTEVEELALVTELPGPEELAVVTEVDSAATETEIESVDTETQIPDVDLGTHLEGRDE